MATVKTQLVDPLGRNIGGVPNPTITNVVNTTPITPVSPTPVSTAPEVSPTLQAIRAAKAITPTPTAPVAQENTGPQTGNTINMTAEQYAAGVAKVGKEKMDASMQKYLNQGGTLTGQQASITGDKVSSVNELKEKPVQTEPFVPQEATQNPITEEPKKAIPEPVAEAPKPVVPVSAQNVDEAFATLMSGGTLADTRENYGFKAVYGQFNAINSLDEKTLGTKMAQGTITPQMSNLLARYNPAKFAAAQKIANDTTVVNDINTNAERLHNTTTGTTPKPAVKTSEEMMQDLVDGIEKVGEKYSDIVAKAYADNPEIKEKGDKLAVLDDKIDTLDTEIDKMYETYRTQYPDVPQAMLIGMVNRATYGLTQERNALVKESKLLYSQYKDAKEMIDKGIEYDIAQEEKMNERLFDLKTTLYGNKRADEIRDEDYARAEERILNDRTYTEEQRKIALEDNLKIALSDLGEKFNPDADYNTLLGQYADAKLKQIESRQNLDIYQAETQRLNAIKTNATSKTSANKQIGAIPLEFNSRALGQPIPVQQESDGSISINIPDGTILGECGTLANDYGQNISGFKRVGNSWESKKANVNSNEPVAGGLVMWTPGNFEENGHIGIVEKVFNDGSFQIFDTNYVGKGVANHRIIKPGDREYKLIQSDGGFFDPGMAQAPLDSNQRVFRSQELTRFKDGQKDFLTALDQYRNLAVSLVEDPTGVSDLGSVYTFMKTLDPNSVVRETEFATAAAASGFSDRNTIKQYYEKFKKGVILTGKQRDDMLKISKKFVEQRAERYDADYDSLINALRGQGITDKSLYPVRASDFIKGSKEDSKQVMDEAELLETQQSIFEAKKAGKTKDQIYNELKALGVDPLLFDY